MSSLRARGVATKQRRNAEATKALILDAALKELAEQGLAGARMDEIAKVAAVNKALDRLDQGFRLQREFTADAAHELRTPLSILRTRVETLDDPRVAKALHSDIEAMSRVVGQLLDIAELEAFTIDPCEVADLQAACAEVAEFIAPLALEQGREIALLGATAPVWIKGNAEMIKRAIRNLAENAIRHTPKDTVVEFVVEENGTVTVQNLQAYTLKSIWRR